MRLLRVVSALCLIVAVTAGVARADLDSFLSGLNTRASADIDEYGTRLSVQFETPLPQVQSLLRSVAVPADAFMCLQLARMLGLAPERVVQTYNANRGRGWGVIAQEMGIKPGSPEFHALKRGDFVFTGQPAPASSARGKGGQGTGKGQDKQNQGQGKGKHKND